MTDHKFTDEEIIKALECCFLSSKAIKSLIAEAIKEFAEKLKERAYTSAEWSHGEHPKVVECDDIDDLVEEMTEGKT